VNVDLARFSSEERGGGGDDEDGSCEKDVEGKVGSSSSWTVVSGPKDTGACFYLAFYIICFYHLLYAIAYKLTIIYFLQHLT